MAGRLILIKSMLDIMPIYWFTLFLIPSTIINSLERIRRNFMWGQKIKSKRKLHLLNWRNICMPKKQGGLGIVPLKSRILAMLGKWWWKFCNEKGSFWNNVMVQWYGRVTNHNLSAWSTRNDLSLIVQSFLNLSQHSLISPLLCKERFVWNIRNGERTYF